MASTQRSYDYTKPGTYPRSGRETLGGIVFLPRTIDKMRAHINGTAGDYVALRGLSTRVFDLFGVTAEQLLEAVRQNPDDEGVLRWLQEHGTKQPTREAIGEHNDAVLTRGPQDEAGMERFRTNLKNIGHPDRTDIKTYVDAEDLEEGREVPRRS